MRRSKSLVNQRVSLAVLLLLAACGGDSGSSSGPVIVPPVTPTPTPTPAPTPTFSYISVNDYARDRSYSNLDHYVAERFSSAVGQQVQAPLTVADLDGYAANLSYVAADGRLVLDFPAAHQGGSGSTLAVTEADRVSAPVGNRAYEKNGDRLLISTPASTDYVARVTRLSLRQSGAIGMVAGYWDLLRVAVFGPPTNPADSLPAGVTYRGQLFISTNNTDNIVADKMVSPVILPVDFVLAADGITLSGRMVVPKGPQEAATFRFAGQLDRATGQISGQVTDEIAPTIYDSGTFAGRLFGPRGVEIGLKMRMVRHQSQNVAYAGDFTGKR